MAKKGSRTRKTSSFGDYSFIRCPLSAEEKKEAKAFAEKSADMLDVKLSDVLKTGHKVSFSYSETNDNVICTFTGKEEESLNEFKMLTSFGSSWWVALATNLYKHEVLFKSSVWESVEDEEDFG